MKGRQLLRFVFAGLLAPISQVCLAAGPPFITDDPEPVDFLHWEVYIASIDYHQFGVYSGTLPHLEVNFGALPNIQLHLIAPLSYASATGQPFEYGYGDTELGVKYRFVQEKGRRPMIGIFPLVEVPTGDEARGLGAGSPAVYLPLWIQKTIGAWTLYGGGGFWHNPGPGNHDYWFSGVTGQCQTTKPLMLGFELFHTTPQVVGTREITGFNVGGVYDFNEGHHLLFSAGTGLQGEDHGTAYLAYQWTFGPHEKADKSAPASMLFGGLRHEL
jgi:hypothetical protein